MISQGIEAAIVALGLTHHGNITRHQLLDFGLTDDAIRHRLRNGRLFRVYPGVYSIGRPAAVPHERASAAVLACGPGAVLSHASAMVLWGFWRHWEKSFEVTIVGGDRRPRGIRVHRSTTLRRRDATTQLGIRVTTPARTLRDMAPRLSDKSLKRKVNQALGSLWLTEDQVADAVARHWRAPGAARIGRLIGLEGTPTRSGWEDDFPDFCRRHGLPAPVMGAHILGFVVDALFPVERVIVELDGWEFHKGKIAFDTDRDRDTDTLAGGYVTVRATWERIENRPQREASRLHAILAHHAPRAA